jgi:phosphoribosyl-AMP cyclohydrolase
MTPTDRKLTVADIDFGSEDLIPAVSQDAASGEVLMVAFMSPAALNKTLETGDAWFWSRSRQELWHKGATSGNFLRVQSIGVNCKENSLVLKVRPTGPACHTGNRSCFYRELDWRPDP